ncbi:MAG: hypothetical protein WCP16_25880 [Pseudanabaena sp. ELA645]
MHLQNKTLPNISCIAQKWFLSKQSNKGLHFQPIGDSVAIANSHDFQPRTW